MKTKKGRSIQGSRMPWMSSSSITPFERRWTPVRNGLTYCSPACGRGCTVKEHDEAVSKAKRLAMKLGDDWKSRVWENLGWYYEAISPCGRMRVGAVEDRRGAVVRVLRYDADLGGHSGNSPGQWIGEGKTPAAAVRNAIKKYQATLEALALYGGRPFGLHRLLP